MAKLICGLLLLRAALALNVLGDEKEFPPRWHLSVRSLTDAMRHTRPADLRKEVSQLPETMRDGRRYMLKVNASALLDLSGLSEDVLRIEEHFSKRRELKHPETSQFLKGQTFKITNFAHFYNLFYLNSTAVGRFYWAVKAAFHRYADDYGVDLRKTYFLRGWFNCVREGGRIMLHDHGPLVSGNLAIRVPKDSFTLYKGMGDSGSYKDIYKKCGGNRRAADCPWLYKQRAPAPKSVMDKARKFPNRDGELSIFLGSLDHSTSDFGGKNENGGPCRMTAAFDIGPSATELHHSVPIYHPDDPFWEKDDTKWADNLNELIEDLMEEHHVPPLFSWRRWPSAERFGERYKIIFDGDYDADIADVVEKRARRQGWRSFKPLGQSHLEL